jgi:hypothetical protein
MDEACSLFAVSNVVTDMEQKPLSERELKRLQKIDRKLSRGRFRFGLFGLAIGAAGGLGWVVMMWLAAPGFGTNMRVSPPTGREQHAMLEQIFYWLATHFGPVIAICVLAAGMFGAMGAGLTFGLAWRLMIKNHADLAVRAIACKQFVPQFTSALLRKNLAAA